MENTKKHKVRLASTSYAGLGYDVDLEEAVPEFKTSTGFLNGFLLHGLSFNAVPNADGTDIHAFVSDYKAGSVEEFVLAMASEGRLLDSGEIDVSEGSAAKKLLAALRENMELKKENAELKAKLKEVRRLAE